VAGIDYRGSRRVEGVEQWVWYLLAGTSYVAAGMWHKWLLNWFVGPLWLITILVVGPWLTDRAGLTGGRRARRSGDRAP